MRDASLHPHECKDRPRLYRSRIHRLYNRRPRRQPWRTLETAPPCDPRSPTTCPSRCTPICDQTGFVKRSVFTYPQHLAIIPDKTTSATNRVMPFARSSPESSSGSRGSPSFAGVTTSNGRSRMVSSHGWATSSKPRTTPDVGCRRGNKANSVPLVSRHKTLRALGSTSCRTQVLRSDQKT